MVESEKEERERETRSFLPHVKTGFHMLRIAEKGLLALQIVYFLFGMSAVYRPHPLCWHVLMRNGSSIQVITVVECCNAELQSTLGMCSREL